MRFVIVTLVAVVISGCMPTIQPSPEQMQVQQQMMQKLLGRMNGAQFNQVAALAQPSSPLISEEELSKKFETVPNLSQGVEIVKKKDGFEVDGRRYVDPEGIIVKYGFDGRTGDVTYITKTGTDAFVIKSSRVNTGFVPVAIATAQKNAEGWSVTTVTGKKMTGETLIAMSRGILVGREASAFVYTPGQNILNIAVSDGFVIAPFQNGNISKTRYMLIERLADKESGSVGSVISVTKNLGSTFGLNKKEDYMLQNIDTGRTVAINVSLEGKETAAYSKCRSKNSKKAFVTANECEKVDFYESLFDRDGWPNWGHYFWRINWVYSDSGTIVIVKENGLREISLTNLKTGKKVVAFKRMLGINNFSINEGFNGKVSVRAQLGLSSETIDDIENFINNAQPEKS